MTSSMEDYLEAVLMVKKEQGNARCTDVAERLGVKKPSVSRAVKELSKSGHLVKMMTAHSPSQKQDCSLPNRFMKNIVFYGTAYRGRGRPQNCGARCL